MSVYHINAKGDAGLCKAGAGKCPFAKPEEHFSSKQEATAAAEKKLSEQHGALTSSQKHEPIKLTGVYAKAASALAGRPVKSVEDYAKAVRQDFALVKDAQPIGPKEILLKAGLDRLVDASPELYIRPGYKDMGENEDEYVLEVSLESDNSMFEYYEDSHPVQKDDSSKKWALLRIEEEDGYYDNRDDYDYRDPTRKRTWTYELPAEDSAAYRARERFVELEEAHRRLENKELPTWAALPATVASTYVFRSSPELDKAKKEVEALEAKLKKLTSPAMGKRIANREEKISAAASEREAIAKFVGDDAPEAVKKLAEPRLSELASTIERLNRDQSRDKSASSTLGTQVLELELSKAKEKLKETEDVYYKATSAQRFSRLAASYPDPDGRTRMAKAREWIKDHPLAVRQDLARNVR